LFLKAAVELRLLRLKLESIVSMRTKTRAS